MHYKWLFTICSLLIISLQIQAKEVNLSNESEVYLLTCSSGEELYSVFGHSAIRVKDDSLGIDLVFNYGTFDFDTPNFYGKFMNGDLNYMLSYTTFDRFIYSYKHDMRGVSCGKLDMTYEERDALWQLLLDNIKPQNKYYRYDFFFDNCATRIRDIIFKVKNIDIDRYSKTSGRTYRDYLHALAGETSWKSQGVDLVLGIKADRIASLYERAYIPLYLDSLFHEAGLVSAEIDLLSKKTNENSSIFDYFTPNVFSILLLLVSIFLFGIEYRRKKYYIVFDILIFTSSVLVGLLLLYLGLLTKHTITEWNLNCLWASLLYIPILYFLIVKKIKTNNYLHWMSFVNNLILLVLFLLSALGVQSIPTMSYYIAGVLFVRNSSIYRFSK